MLQYAWVLNDPEVEIQCYDRLSILYYNMSDLANSKIYNERALNRILEPETSRTKQMAIEEIKTQQRKRDCTRAFGKYI